MIVDSMPSMAQIDALIGDAVRFTAATDPDPADPYRGQYLTDADAERAAVELDGGRLDARLHLAATALALDPLDATLLALCAAPTLDAGYGRLIGYLHDDLTRRYASPRLLARLLSAHAGEQLVLERLAIDAPLRRGGALATLPEAPPALPVIDRLLTIDDQLAAVLFGARIAEDEVERETRVVVPDGPSARGSQALARIASVVASAEVPVLLAGADAERIAAQALGRTLVLLEARKLGDERLLARARLRATLSRARLAIVGLDGLESEDERLRLHRAVEALDDPLLLCCERTRVPPALRGLAHLTVPLTMPDRAQRARLWSAHVPDADPDDPPAELTLSAGQIELAARLARAEARAAERSYPHGEDLRRAALRVSRRQLDEHATLLDDTCDWDDLVLGEDALAALRAIAARLRHRSLVLDTWGFGRRIAPSAGLKILFSGEPGTGKTMAARVIADDLGVDLYSVDLARIVSKFVGETEKRLARLFDEAEDANAMIFFDEADALFGKRSSVSDAHDRYANIEVAYLLQRIERFAGAAILATNLRQNLDQAFLRRLDFVVELRMPDRALRRRLWERHLPDEAPVSSDVDLDALAAHSLSGGAIRNCVLHAAFAAADGGGEAISAAHLQQAVHLEQRKLGRLATTREPTR